jgi:transposase
MGLYRRPRAPVRRLRLHDYTPNRKRDGPLAFLGNFSGYLQADAYAGYDALYAGDRVRGIACWAHARRKFFNAQSSAKATAAAALAYIGALYDVEREARDQKLKGADRQALCQERSSQVLTSFRRWLDQEAHIALPKSAIGQAIGYALNHWPDLVRYLDDGRLDIDNNVAERELRPIAVGRKNWSFAGSDAGGRRAAVIYSVIASYRRHGVGPYAYITDVLERVSMHPANRVIELLPGRWTPPAKPVA